MNFVRSKSYITLVQRIYTQYDVYNQLMNCNVKFMNFVKNPKNFKVRFPTVSIHSVR